MHTEPSAIRHVSSSTSRKSSPPAEEKTPGTFSHTMNRGRTASIARPFRSSSVLISFTMRICSLNKPERAPAKPFRCPAADRSWQGEPPLTISTGGSSAPFSRVMSPTCTRPGKCSCVTRIGNGSISLAHTGRMPWRAAASKKPPMPSNKLPKVSDSPVKPNSSGMVPILHLRRASGENLSPRSSFHQHRFGQHPGQADGALRCMHRAGQAGPCAGVQAKGSGNARDFPCRQHQPQAQQCLLPDHH